MKNKLLIGFLLGVSLLLFGLAGMVFSNENGENRPIDTNRMKAEDYPLGDIKMDEATFQKYYRQYPVRVLDTLPTSYNAHSEGIVSVAKNQGSCGSCWAFATAGAMESHIKRTYPAAPLYDLSEQQQVSCNTSMWGCSGGSASAIQFWVNKGANIESDYPYVSGGGSVPACVSGYNELTYRVANFHTTSGTENYKASLYDKGPSYWRFSVHKDFQDYWNGSETKAYLNTANNYQGGHAVLIIGWDDNKDVVGGGKGAFLCKNSWGASGGPIGDGTFWIAYSGHANDLGFGMCNFDVFDNTLPPELTVISPNGGESLVGGNTHTITWSSTGAVGNVKIDFSTDNGVNWTPLIGSTTNDGSYSWIVANTPSTTCQVRVAKADGGDPADTSDAVFSILPYVAPFISVTSPASSSLWEKGKTYAITWLKHGTQNASVKILLYKGSSTLVKTIVSTTPNDGSFDWLVPAKLVLGSTYFVRIKTVDNLITDDSEKFSIIVPTLTVTAPTTGTVWVKEAVKTITWNKQGTQDTNIKILLYKGTSKKLEIIPSAPNNGSFEWFIPSTLANGSNYTIRVITLDGKVIGKSAPFSIVTAVIRVTQPMTGAKLIRGTQQVITWTAEGAVNATVKIQLFKGTSKVLDISPGVPTADGAFTWDIPAAQVLASTYRIRIITVDSLVKADSGKFTIATSAGLKLTTPNGGEMLKTGEPHIIRWTDDPGILTVKLEFSRDNGNTYTTIADQMEDSGAFKWTVPVSFTPNCIMRVSDTNGRLWREEGLIEYIFNFIYSGANDEPGMQLWFGSADANAPSHGFGRIDIGNQVLGFDGFNKTIKPLTGSWHELKVRLDLRRDTAEIRLDDMVLFEHAALNTTRERYFGTGLVLQAGNGQALELAIDDLEINILRRDNNGENKESYNVLKDDFDRYDERSNGLHNCWQWQEDAAGTENAMELRAENSWNQSLYLRTNSGKPILLRLPFVLPERIPFDISDKCFAIEQ